MTTRRRSISAAVLGITIVMLAPVHATAYDANAARPDASAARFMLPDLEVDGAMDPFGDNLMPRRAMEHPREWTDFAFATIGLACSLWSSGICGGVAAAVFVYEAVQLFDARSFGCTSNGSQHYSPSTADLPTCD